MRFQHGKYYPGRITFLLLLLFGGAAVNSSVANAALNIRIAVSETALYVLNYDDLGLNQIITSDNLNLYNRGQAVAIIIDDGNDGFGPGDSLRFYGQSIKKSDAEYKYTNENIYWLRDDASSPERMLSCTDCSGASNPISNFRYTLHAENNWTYWQQMPDGVGRDHWFWGPAIKVGTSRSFIVSLQSPANDNVNATVKIAFQGATSLLNDRDHHTQVWMNDALLEDFYGDFYGDFYWDGQKPLEKVFTVPANSLIDGDNIIRIDELSDHNSVVDSIYVDWIEVSYQRFFFARSNQLEIHINKDSARTLTVSKFTSNDIAVYDISDPDKPRQLNLIDNGHDYSVTFDGRGRYLAIAKEAYKIISSSVITHGAENEIPLKSTNNGADYLLITHSSLKEAVYDLAQHRASEKGGAYRVTVVTTEQIYNEFSDGLFTPQAIKDFIAYAYHNWQSPAPEYVLMAGDANQDYKDHYQTGQINLVPAYMIETAEIGETPSDNWFVTVAGEDVIPDLLIGRIPAKTANDMRIITNKIIDFETTSIGAWRSRILTAVGDHEERYINFTNDWFEDLASEFTRILINPLDYVDKYLARADFFKAINGDGVSIVTYFGHGSVDQWLASADNGAGGLQALELLASDDMKSLSNDRAYPLFVAFNCLNGFFSLPFEGKAFNYPDGSGVAIHKVPLSEALLFQENKGAIAVWSPTALAYPSDLNSIGEEFFAAIFNRDERILGKILTQTKVRAYQDHGVSAAILDLFILIGDPATQLKLADEDMEQGGCGSVSVAALLLLLMSLSLHYYVRRYWRRS